MGALVSLAWAVVPFLAARVPAAERLLPVLGVLRGPLGVALLAAGVAVAAWRWAGRDVRERPLPRGGAFGLAALLLLSAGLWYTSRLRVSGDEPHYLLMAQSLWREGDLDLRDNLAREDYLEYTPGPVVPHYGAPRLDARPFPAHSPGLPAVLAPVYALAGRIGCVVLIALAAAALAVQTQALALRSGFEPAMARLAWAAALGPPVLFYSFHIYTEVPSALASWVSLGLLLAQPGVPAAAGAALLAAALPWLHVKMVPAAAVLGLVALCRLRGRPLIAFCVVAGAMSLAYLGYYQAIFGRPSPLALYGGVPRDATGSPPIAAAGLLFDRSFGLLPHAPVFLLALAGLPLLARRRDVWPHLLVAAAVFAPLLTWRMWWGGQCPPGRFLVPLVPLLALAVAARVAAAPGRGLARWVGALLALGLGLGLCMIARPGELLLLNRGDRPTRLWAELSGDVEVGRYLPSLVSADAAEMRVAVIWLAATVVLLGLDALARRHDGVDRLFRGPGLVVGLLLAIGGFVDYWARR
jgi:hypothetical protein